MRRYPPRPAGPHTGRSPNRNRAAQARLRRALLARANGQCEHPGCTATTDLRAAHLISVRNGGDYEPANALLLCKTHDKATDPYAR